MGTLADSTTCPANTSPASNTKPKQLSDMRPKGRTPNAAKTRDASRWCTQPQLTAKAENQQSNSPTTSAGDRSHTQICKPVTTQAALPRYPTASRQTDQPKSTRTSDHSRQHLRSVTSRASNQSTLSKAPQQARLNSGARNTSNMPKGEAPPQPTRQPQRQTGLDHIQSCRRPERHHALRDGAQ